MFWFMLISVFALGLGAPFEENSYGIVKGKDAKQSDFFYQVSLELYGNHHCGATLITPNICITAAHCTKDTHYSNFKIRAGTQMRGGSDGTVVEVAEIVDHPDFSFDTVHSDISIIKLKKHLKLSKNIGVIDFTDVEPAAHTKVNVSGWGVTEENGNLATKLQFATVEILDRDTCAKYVDPFTKEMICAGMLSGGSDACQADSGGPLVADKKLVGVVSWGDGCGQENNPGVYTNVANFHSWILKTIEKLNSRMG